MKFKHFSSAILIFLFIGCATTPSDKSYQKTDDETRVFKGSKVLSWSEIQKLDRDRADLRRREAVFIQVALAPRFAERVYDVREGNIPGKEITAALLGERENSSLDDNLANKFTTAFLKLGWVIVERSRLSQVLSEHALSMSGVLETEARHAIGQILGINTIVICTTELPYPYEKGSLRFIDVEIGEVVGSATFQWASGVSDWGPSNVAFALYREGYRVSNGR